MPIRDGLDPRLLLEPPLAFVLAPLLGLIVGSFANVCIYRLPRGLSIVFPPSACPGCATPIRPYDNIPVLSYVLLRGRCRRCGVRISPRYPMVELLNGALWWGVATVHGASLWTAVWCVFATAMLVLALVDLEHQLLPDAVTLPGVALGLAASFLPGSSIGPVEAAATALGGYTAMAVVAKAYRWLRGIEGLGHGDWKLVAMLGAFFGWRQTMLVVFLASFSGMLVGIVLATRRSEGLKTALPLGSFLAAAALVCMFSGAQLLEWYGLLFPGFRR